MKTRNFEARDEKVVIGTPAKVDKKESQSALRESRQSLRKLAAQKRLNVSDGKQKSDIPKKDSCSFRHDTILTNKVK